MQKKLDLLNEHCKCSKLNSRLISVKQNWWSLPGQRIRNILTFKFGNMDLDQVEDYIYLGTCFNWNGSFVKTTPLLDDKASKAKYSLTQKGRRLKL